MRLLSVLVGCAIFSGACWYALFWGLMKLVSFSYGRLHP